MAAVWYKVRFFIIFLTTCASVGLCVVAAATQWWVFSWPVRDVNTNITKTANNVEKSSKFTGNANFGLFYGYKQLDWGFGTSSRGYFFTVDNSLSTDLEFSFALWVLFLISIFAAIFSASLVLLLAFINLLIVPKTECLGSGGAKIMMAITVAFQLLTILFYLLLYFIYWRQNVLSRDERTYLWKSAYRSAPNYSFYLLLVSPFWLLFNLFLLKPILARVRFCCTRQVKLEDVHMDRVIVY